MRDFSGVIDPVKTISAGSLATLKRFQRGHTPLKFIGPRWKFQFKIVVLGPQHFLKREYPTKLFHREISPLYHILILTKKSWGILDFIFGFIGVIDPAETDVDDFQSDYLGQWIRALGGVDWWKKTEGRKSRATAPLKNDIVPWNICFILVCRLFIFLILRWTKNR
jgi:hypothetical protein